MFFDVALEDDLRMRVQLLPGGRPAARGRRLLDDNYLIGLSDAGAHLTLLADHAYTTYFLGRWIRERGLMPLEQAVRKLTPVPAELLRHPRARRAARRAGSPTSCCSIRRASSTARPKLVYDLPGGGPRLLTKADGIEAVIVNGEVAVERGELTGARSGQVIRGAGGRN